MRQFVKNSILFLFLIYSGSLFSQNDSLLKDTTITLFPRSSGDKKWKVLIGLDARRSFFASSPVKLNGLKLGAEYKGVHRFGFGFYWLKKNLIFTDIPVNEPNSATEPEIRFDLGYSSIFYERVFLKTRWWEVAFPIHLGGGTIRATYKDTLGAFNLLFQRPFSTLALSAQLKFYPLTWLALRTSLGYRLTFNTDTQIKKAFNKPFFGFGLSINILELYRSIFKNEKTPSKKQDLENYEDNR